MSPIDSSLNPSTPGMPTPRVSTPPAAVLAGPPPLSSSSSRAPSPATSAGAASRADSPAEEEGRRSVAETASRVCSVALQALDIQKRIVSGKYHFRDNILVVKVETKKVNSEGEVVEKSQKDVAFEVVGLSYKEAGGEYVNVLGARTEAALKPIFDALFKALENVEDVDPFLDTDLPSEGAEKDPNNPLKEHVKTLTFSHTQQLGDLPEATRANPSPQRPVLKDGVQVEIRNHYAGLEGRPDALNFSNLRHTVTEASLKDRTLLSQMLAAPQWRLMLKEAKDRTLTEHAWTFSSDHVQECEKQVSALCEALFDETQEGEAAPTCYADQLVTQATAMRKQLKPLQIDAANLKKIKHEIDEEIDQLQVAYEDREQELNEFSYYRVLVAHRRQVRELLDEVQERLTRLFNGVRTSEEIQALEFGTKFRAQRKALGKAAFGKNVSMDWYYLFERAGLLEETDASAARLLQQKLEIYPQEDVDQLVEKSRALSIKMRGVHQIEGLCGLEDYEEDDFVSAVSHLDLEELQTRDEERRISAASPSPSMSTLFLDEEEEFFDPDALPIGDQTATLRTPPIEPRAIEEEAALAEASGLRGRVTTLANLTDDELARLDIPEHLRPTVVDIRELLRA